MNDIEAKYEALRTALIEALNIMQMIVMLSNWEDCPEDKKAQMSFQWDEINRLLNRLYKERKENSLSLN